MVPRAMPILRPPPRRSWSRCGGFTRGDWRSWVTDRKTNGTSSGKAPSSFPDVQLRIVDAHSVGNCRPEAQARNPYSRGWLWIPGSLASLAPQNDGFLLCRDRLVGREARQQRLQGDQRRMIGDAVDARRAEVALKGGDHFHGRPVVICADRDAVTIFGQRLLQVANVVADGAELE